MIDSGTRERVAALVLAGATALALAACSSSKPTATASSSPHSSGVTAGGAPDAQTAAAIKNAYTKFFLQSTPEDVSLGLLQDGQAFKAAVEQNGQSSLAQTSTAVVSKIVLVSPNTARVTYSILISGNPILKDQPGYAVRENGVWKVAGATFCGLLTLEGNPPAVCHSASATALPN